LNVVVIRFDANIVKVDCRPRRSSSSRIPGWETQRSISFSKVLAIAPLLGASWRQSGAVCGTQLSEEVAMLDIAEVGGLASRISDCMFDGKLMAKQIDDVCTIE
jgi:hypothetical protein